MTTINIKNLIGTYENGNYTVSIYNDGTKVRSTKKKLIPDFAENCDVKITDFCDGGCEFCYEGCSTKGKHAELLNQKWVQTLHPYTELALNGNDLSHPQLLLFLQLLKSKNVIANLTVNQKHFMKNLKYIHQLVDSGYIYGLGVSLVEVNDEFLTAIQEFPNAVIHTIAGILSPSDIIKLADKDLKLLILGYKELNRGIDFLSKNKEEIESRKEILQFMLPSMQGRFNVISFDNLALEQLNVKTILNIDDKEWQKIYMGDDGKFTFYIDMVNQQFAKNSVADKRYDILNSVDDMFKIIQESK